MIPKYRAWFAKDKKMEEVWVVYPETTDEDFVLIEDHDHYGAQTVDGKDCVLMQWTGLHDATSWDELAQEEQAKWLSSGHKADEWCGKDIYEGDIVQWWGARRKKDAPEYGVVSYVQHEGGFGIKWKDRMESVACQCRHVIVVGNIYQNSDLLSDWDQK